eukprot:scpid105677/ scgid3136/ 
MEVEEEVGCTPCSDSKIFASREELEAFLKEQLPRENFVVRSTMKGFLGSAIDILAAKDLRHVWQHHRMCVPIDFHGVPFCVLGRQECQFGKERCHEAKQPTDTSDATRSPADQASSNPSHEKISRRLSLQGILEPLLPCVTSLRSLTGHDTWTLSERSS